MEPENIIKAVSEPTEWVNSMVVVAKKNKDLRICIDPRDLNKVIKREYFVTVSKLVPFRMAYFKLIFYIWQFDIIR